jgi:uncharacterized membrane protein YraQ (UPF0718 family)
VLFGTAIALLSIGLGTALGLLPGSSSRAGGPLQTFALVTAVAVVLGQLLPESLSAIGVPALLAFAFGYALPRVAERAAVAFRKPACTHDDAMCTDLGLELGYAALLLHHVGDGLGLGLFTSELHEGHDHWDVLAALAGHTVPVTALLAMAFKTHRGAASAAWRALGIAAALVLGVALASSLDHEQLVAYEPWLTAFVSGLLLHIVAHGWPAELRPTRGSRVIDFAAIAAGLAIVMVGGHSHASEHGQTDVRAAMGDALVELGLETAPMLLLGLLVAAFLQTQGARIPARVLSSGGRLTQALRGALIGIPLPVCACGILPVAHSLRARGGAAAVVVAFMLATPELGVDTFALSVQFLGWPFALLRLFGAVLVAVTGGLLVARFANVERCEVHEAVTERPFASAPPRPLLSQVAANFDELLYHVGAWTLLGLLAAAYLQAALTDGALASVAASGFDVVIISLIAVPSYVCASSATPLAAVLLAKGVSPGAVLAGLLLGPATNVATLAWLRKAYGQRAAIACAVGLLSVTWVLAYGVNAFGSALVPVAATQLAHEHSHGPVAYLAALALFALVLRAVWRDGLRSWLGSLGEALSFEAAPDVPRPAHAHGHAHHHAHEHAHAHHDH